jgi:hypothetical protein
MHSKRKLTPEQLTELRTTNTPLQQLAGKWGIATSTLGKARLGFTYKKELRKEKEPS